jgi:tetratricopeptide (TPR) repeat protein
VLFSEAKELAEKSGDLRSKILVHCYYAHGRMLAGQVVEARAAVKDAVRLGDQAPDSDLKALVSFVHAFMLAVGAGECREALPICEDAIALSKAEPKVVEEVFGYPVHWMLVSWRGLALGLAGRLQEGTQDIEGAIAIGQQDQPVVAVSAYNIYLWLADLLNNAATAMAHARHCAQLAAEMGVMEVFSELNLGIAHSLSGDCEEAIHVLNRGLATCRARRSYLFTEPIYLNALSRAYLAQGDYRLARATAEEAVTLAGDRGWYGVDAYLSLARSILRAQGSDARRGAESALAAAERRIESSGAGSRRAYLHELRAQLARTLGRQAECEHQLSEAHRLFTEMNATGHAERLAKELGL